MVCKPIPRQSFKQRRHRRWRKQKTEKPICQLCQDVRQSKLLPPSTIQHALKFSQVPISYRSDSRSLGSTFIFYFYFLVGSRVYHMLFGWIYCFCLLVVLVLNFECSDFNVFLPQWFTFYISESEYLCYSLMVK